MRAAVQPHYKHSYEETTCDDEGNDTGKMDVYCVDGKLAYDFDRNPDGEVEPLWFLDVESQEPAACRVCTGEVKLGYEDVLPTTIKVVMPYAVAKCILDCMHTEMATGVQGWDHSNDNACQEDAKKAKDCSLCLVEDWLDRTLRPALKPRRMKARGKR